MVQSIGVALQGNIHLDFRTASTVVCTANKKTAIPCGMNRLDPKKGELCLQCDLTHIGEMLLKKPVSAFAVRAAEAVRFGLQEDARLLAGRASLPGAFSPAFLVMY